MDDVFLDSVLLRDNIDVLEERKNVIVKFGAAVELP